MQTVLHTMHFNRCDVVARIKVAPRASLRIIKIVHIKSLSRRAFTREFARIPSPCTMSITFKTVPVHTVEGHSKANTHLFEVEHAQIYLTVLDTLLKTTLDMVVIVLNYKAVVTLSMLSICYRYFYHPWYGLFYSWSTNEMGGSFHYSSGVTLLIPTKLKA